MRTSCSTISTDPLLVCDTWEDMSRIRPGTQDYQVRSGDAYLELFKDHGDLQDLEMALNEYQQGLDLLCSSERERAFYHDKIGKCWLIRAEQSNDLVDIQKSIQHYQQALQLAAQSPTDCILYHHNLGTALSLAYDLHGLKENSNLNPSRLLDEAIVHLDCSINLLTDANELQDARSNSFYHEVLGRALLKRFQLWRSVSDLRSSILHLRFSADTNPCYDICRGPRYQELGELLYQLSFLTQTDKSSNSHPESSVHLGNSIRYYTRALNLTWVQSDCSTLYNALGLSYFARFEQSELQYTEDVQVAINHYQRAIDLIPKSQTDSRLRQYHLNLGTAYLACYVSAARTETNILSIERLEDVIRHLRIAIDSSHEYAEGTGAHSGPTGNLSQAVAYGREALSHMQRIDPHYLTLKEMVRDLADRCTSQQSNDYSAFKFDDLRDILSKM